MALTRVWAPRPSQVGLACGERVEPMTRTGGGRWSLDASRPPRPRRRRYRLLRRAPRATAAAAPPFSNSW